ncbi:hypothetical protein FB550_102444 [Neobacillus bataviensis]|uniref:Uncharacterized protein n=1 Tax=Neobacillus bataviensis TaxID=220685 RepID=A0A561DSS6_9BACI|nr:hypothetical protein [Neobacillus bataviensis]TWE06422.1 hypothetical protein FB550_102444 [Neobacillus bataviensis]
MTNLSKQVFIYSLGTFSFHDDEENKIFKKMQNLKGYKKRLSQMKSNLNSSELSKKDLKEAKRKINDEIKQVNQEVTKLKLDLYEAFDKHEGTRTLRQEELNKRNVIAVFDSVLTRTLEMEGNEPSEDIVIIQSYHFQVLEGLIKDGFYNSKGEKYIFFSGSAGQIRQKKGVWIKETLWNTYKDTLTCGLDIAEINEKGGCNINKYLSYKALINSASEEIKDFDINKCIVVDDMELTVNDEVDYINRDTFEIERQSMDVPITATDGVGMILPSISKKNFMVRLPWIKGLLASYDFTKHGNKVKDIYNREWDVIDDQIEIIFTKSQFKMHSYFESWDDYKERFEKYNCQAAKLNEEDDFNDGKLSYQMLQSLVNVTDEELENIASSTIEDIRKIGEDQEVMLKVLGATETNERKRSFQNALLMYPQLLNDAHSKETIKTKKKALVNDARTGKLNVNGAFTFIIPDLYSFCEMLFKGEAKSLLKKNEVYYRKHEEGMVSILRSPHLYREWGIKNNVLDAQKEEYFQTDAIYVSNEDLLSKLIQCDFDGDKVLVLSEHKDSTLLEIAQRNMHGIVPLYYKMEKAKPQEINGNNIYAGLKAAFDSNGAIGEYSNNVTKVWNSENVNLDAIRYFCMICNFEIDYAKTLFHLNTEKIDEELKQYINANLPHFFAYDKRKNKKNKGKVVKKVKVEDSNTSTVNRLEDIIPNKRINFQKVAGRFDYRLLMRDKKVVLDTVIIEKYTELDQNKKDLIKIDETSKKKGKLYIYQYIRDELLKVNDDPYYVTDVLIEYLYGVKDSKYKDSLWESFGDIIEENLTRNLIEAKECEDCGDKYRKTKKRQVRCEGCQKKRDRENSRLRMQKKRKNDSA